MKAGNDEQDCGLENITDEELALLFPIENMRVEAAVELDEKEKASKGVEDLPLDVIKESSGDVNEKYYTCSEFDKVNVEGERVHEPNIDEDKKDKGKVALDEETLRKMENNLFVFVSEKAGMETIDKETVAKKIEEASKSSEYYKRQKEKLELVKLKVEEKKKQLIEAQSNTKLYTTNKMNAQRLFSGYKEQYDVTRTWIHVDMDMFYAAVEIRNNPSLADKPIAVGGYNMISTANYIARKYGVRSAMPGFIGKKLCPDLIFVSYSTDEYAKVSGEVMELLEEYDPDLESMGLDEASLDVTDYLAVKGKVNDEIRFQLAQEIQGRIYEKVKLTASCGVAANKMLSKISCDMKKPNGITLVPFNPQDIEQFMKNLSVRKIPGIGTVNEQLLNGLGFNKCEDIIQRAIDVYILFNTGKMDYFEFYVKSALGIGRNRHVEKEDIKSISVHSTFRNISLYFLTVRTHRLSEFKAKIEELANSLIERVEAQKVMGRTVTLRIKTHKFKVTEK